MEGLGAAASIATFVTIAKSIHDALSAIKDGPQIIRHLSDEIAQLESVLQRLSQSSFSSVDAADQSALIALVKKRPGRGRIWRKLKLCFTEKDLDQIRHVVRGHVQLLTCRLSFIQVQQGSFTATQSDKIFGLLQQLQQDVAALHAAQTSSQRTSDDHGGHMTDQMDLDDANVPPSLGYGLDESIVRLIRLLEKKSCVTESDDSQELVEDLERLLQSVEKDSGLPKTCTCQADGEDVSKEVKLITNLILSAPSMKINQNGE
ncbi:hypothetical protein FHETE_1881 [Fusarium heterosporum]|uniref:Fungal N-terminal domain-containing protein n=1 Tax=Fusarium heterosporum TaxID=42747 RepID=A0A8H5TXN2_FUSHE|nr:hypothetical protein FHETE_1881 [Fusarium heterosporum]